jgi:subtilase family serine protease
VVKDNRGRRQETVVIGRLSEEGCKGLRNRVRSAAMPKRRRGIRPIVDELDDRCLLSDSSGLSPAQITSAYGLNAITFHSSSGQVTGNGAGETIALIEMYHDSNLVSDLHVFDQKYGLPDPTLNVIDQANGQADSSWGQEESLDVEWAHAIAPGASILVVEAAPSYSDTQAFQNLMSAVQTASSTPGVAVVSMSWGFNEFPGETQYDSYFTTPGITYIAASGDNPGVSYPAASPDVLAVGGTTLNLGVLGGYGSETAWYDSGGGYSQFESEPAYQQSVQTTGQRSTPDVAFDGDPNTGVAVYYTPPAGGGFWNASPQGSWSVVGGTSVGAPVWAGIIAIVDQGRAVAGLSNLSGATQTLPSLYGLASNSQTSGDFHAIAPSPTGTPWSNDPGFGFPWGGWGAPGGWPGGSDPGSDPTAGATANTQTGLGTPNGSSLLNDLAASTVTSPLPTPTATPSPSPTGTPNPTPTPTPTPTGGKHRHRHKATHGTAQRKSHATAHASRIVGQAKPIVKDHASARHRT